MKKYRERGMALVVVLGILALFLLVALLILVMTSQNSVNVGNAYQKQTYYDVAEAGIDRGLSDLDTALPSPGASGSLTATPAPPPSPPSANQTPLPNEPNIPYFYSYWYNASTSPTSTPDPLAGTQFCSACTTVNIPAQGAVIWSYTQTGNRDVAVEAVVDRFNETTSSCAICAAQNITVTGSNNKLVVPTSPAPVCGNPADPFKVCSDPNASPSPAPSLVPILAGGSYTCSGPEPSPCAYGDGVSTPNPGVIQQNVSSSVVSNFLASQGTIDQLADSSAWELAAVGSSTINYIDCTSGCSQTALIGVEPGAGQLTYVKGNVNWSPQNALTYSGTWVISGCLNISQPGWNGTSTQATVIVLGTDSQCGTAASIGGGGNTKPALWNGGTLYAAQGSVSISGNGSVKGYNFYGAVVAANSVTISGNGFFAWQAANVAQTLHFLPFAIVSFAQY